MNVAVRYEIATPTRPILGLNIATSDYGETVRKSLEWARNRESRALFFANVHVVMEAFDNQTFRESLNRADMINPDGMPLVWALRALVESSASRVYGPDAMLAMLDGAERGGLPVGFYGGSESALALLLAAVRERNPRLKITFSLSPPFRALTDEEDAEIVREIANSDARILFVGLGCPKQEKWVMEHVGRIPAVMFGVGAAFDFLAGSKPQAPRWMMRSGLEWLFRFLCEPRRLAGRYIKHNPRFIALFLQQLVTSRGARAS